MIAFLFDMFIAMYETSETFDIYAKIGSVFSVIRKRETNDVIKFCDMKGNDVPVPPGYVVAVVLDSSSRSIVTPLHAGVYSNASHFVLPHNNQYKAVYNKKIVHEFNVPPRSPGFSCYWCELVDVYDCRCDLFKFRCM